ncbi:MAG: hypothetical protein ACE5HD_01970 [Acidobacteriota bacterium]
MLQLGDLVPGGPPVLAYQPDSGLQGVAEDDLREALVRLYQSHLEKEAVRGHSLVGPQRDDISLEQAGIDLVRYGSSGQQRAALIALKVAKMLLYEECRGTYPVLLLDDLEAELDARRIRQALGLLGGPYQVLVASSRGLEWDHGHGKSRHLRVRNGIIQRLE